MLIHTSGTVTLDGAWAGGCIDAGCAGIGINTWNYPVTVKNSMTTSNNGQGSTINTDRAITLIAGGAYNNKSDGAFLQNTSALSYPVIITSYTADGNTSNGILVVSNGNITITNTISSNNVSNGATLDNDTCATCFIKILSTGGKWNEFDDNTGRGLQINTNGDITIAKIHVDENQFAGIFLDTLARNFTINDGTANGNGDWGLNIQNLGALTINRFKASDNGLDGMILNNNFDITGTKNVILTKCEANLNGGAGIDVNTYGAISLNNVEASGNGTNGAYLDNDYATAKGISVLSSLGKNQFNGNISCGLEFYTKGSITFNGITADSNVTEQGIGGEMSGAGIATLSSTTDQLQSTQGHCFSANNSVTITNAISLSNAQPGGRRDNGRICWYRLPGKNNQLSHFPEWRIWNPPKFSHRWNLVITGHLFLWQQL